MARYLLHGAYTSQGARGVAQKGGSARAQAIDRMVTGMGGRLESFYFALGEDDFFLVIELPDNIAVAAANLAVAAAGGARSTAIPLLTPEELDRAAQMTVEYAAPGS